MWKTTKIECNKTSPIIVTMTSWKDRINTVYRSLVSLKQQTLKPDKIILWLSSEEINENLLPEDLKNGNWYEIHWVDKNLMSFKKFLSIQQYPNAINIVLDDDKLYNENTLQLLYEQYLKTNKKIIQYVPVLTNTRGQDVMLGYHCSSAEISSVPWCNTSCTLFAPHFFPIEIFKYVDEYITNNNLKLICDESFIMPFLVYYNLQPYSISDWNTFFNLNPHIENAEDTALHWKLKRYYKKDLTDGSIREMDYKYEFIFDFVNSLPNKYKNKWLKTFKDFGNDMYLFGKTNIREKIIVSLTSWTKRIHLVNNVINNFLNQTLLPDKIILTLSTIDFPNKEENLPIELISTIHNNKICEIIWVEDNTKVWKKIFPVLNIYDKDIILGIDDDIPYPNDYIEIMYNEYLFWNKEYPITCFDDPQCIHGGLSLYKKEFFGNYLQELWEKCLNYDNNCPEDIITMYASHLKGITHKKTQKINGRDLYIQCSIHDDVSYSGTYNEEWRKRIIFFHNKVQQYIYENYNKKYSKDLIIVTLTSYPKRIHYVESCLISILEQTILPDKICLNLSIEEFPFKELSLPINLQKFLVEHNNIIEVHWVKYNTKVWKKIIPTLYRYPYSVIISIDDDNTYIPNFIETLLTEHYKDTNRPLLTNPNQLYGNFHTYVGPCGLMRPNHILPVLNVINKDIFEIGADDEFYTYCFQLNNCHGIYINKSYFDFFKDLLTDTYSYSYEQSIKHKGNYCKLTWYKCLETYGVQTKEGEKIIDYICATEYNDNSYDNVTLEQWLFKNQELWNNEYKPKKHEQIVSNKIIMTKAFKKEIQNRHKKINSIKRR